VYTFRSDLYLQKSIAINESLRSSPLKTIRDISTSAVLCKLRAA
jgi:hypothetical protein